MSRADAIAWLSCLAFCLLALAWVRQVYRVHHRAELQQQRCAAECASRGAP